MLRAETGLKIPASPASEAGKKTKFCPKVQKRPARFKKAFAILFTSDYLCFLSVQESEKNAYIYRHDDLYFRSNPTLYVMYGPQIMAEFYGKNHDGKPKKGAQE